MLILGVGPHPPPVGVIRLWFAPFICILLLCWCTSQASFMAVSGFFGFFALILYLNILSGTTGTADSQHIMLSLCFCHLRAKYLSSFAYYAVRAFVLLNADSPSVDDIAAKSSRKDEISAIVRKRLQLAYVAIVSFLFCTPVVADKPLYRYPSFLPYCHYLR